MTVGSKLALFWLSTHSSAAGARTSSSHSFSSTADTVAEDAVAAVTTRGTSLRLGRRGFSWDCENVRFGTDPAAGTADGEMRRSDEEPFVFIGEFATKAKNCFDADVLGSGPAAAARCDWRKTPATTESAEIGK